MALILLLVLFGLFSYSCSDEETIAGCKVYDHVFEDHIGIGELGGTDTVHIFIAAFDDRETTVDIEFIYYEAGWLDDSISVQLNVYGESYENTPYPRSEIVQMSDSFIVWYSAQLFQETYLRCLSRSVLGNAPCIPPYYRADYVTLYHPENVTVVGHEGIVAPYEFCPEMTTESTIDQKN